MCALAGREAAFGSGRIVLYMRRSDSRPFPALRLILETVVGLRMTVREREREIEALMSETRHLRQELVWAARYFLGGLGHTDTHTGTHIERTMCLCALLHRHQE